MSEYQSTRGGVDTLPFSGVITEGLASDHGLFVPVEVSKISLGELTDLSGKPYDEVFAYVVGKFVGNDDIPPEVHQQIARDVYSSPNFAMPSPGLVTPVEQVGEGLFIQNLYDGPTLAFKDMALQPLGRYLEREITNIGGHLAILGASSGDTVSAGEAATKGKRGIITAFMTPDVGMAPFQKAQAAEYSGGNILNISVDGTFDDCQAFTKALAVDPEFNQLGALNSINWGRVLFQVAYYVSGYLQTVGKDIGSPIDVAVPTGNFGNILAAYYAREMGVPIRRLIVATNENSVLDELVQTGVYRDTPSEITTSPSMDISKASNYERLVLDIMARDTTRTRLYMEQFEKTGQVSFDEFGLPMDTMRRIGFESGVSNHATRLSSIGRVYSEAGMFIDPHTADGITVALQHRDPDVPVLCMATAHPAKFEDTVREALGVVSPRPERFVGLEERVAGRTDAFVRVPKDIDAVKAVLRANGFANRT